eukprot:TRINITY_DN65149_c0_g1_i1.p1 TRINITY_DN65149_c0_g1~~TRINITY_DN65149_c0_g1_i1.p1  ORF type:complete len:315 (+),score=67.42 TRINITY_DN65149_c0_g1_i1:55-945(+)
MVPKLSTQDALWHFHMTSAGAHASRNSSRSTLHSFISGVASRYVCVEPSRRASLQAHKTSLLSSAFDGSSAGKGDGKDDDDGEIRNAEGKTAAQQEEEKVRAEAEEEVKEREEQLEKAEMDTAPKVVEAERAEERGEGDSADILEAENIQELKDEEEALHQDVPREVTPKKGPYQGFNDLRDSLHEGEHQKLTIQSPSGPGTAATQSRVFDEMNTVVGKLEDAASMLSGGASTGAFLQIAKLDSSEARRHVSSSFFSSARRNGLMVQSIAAMPVPACMRAAKTAQALNSFLDVVAF